MSPENAGLVMTCAVPRAVPVGRAVHFNLPLSVSTANSPPRFDELPPTIVDCAIAVGAQSLCPGLTVNFSVGAVRRGLSDAPDCGNDENAESMTTTIAAT